jgi:prepilin-type N-terminal cleavage/methylation domain-containing protein
VIGNHQINSRNGFTLLELVVVMFIIAAATAVILPRLPRSSSMERSEALRLMSAHTQAVFEHSAIKKKV